MKMTFHLNDDSIFTTNNAILNNKICSIELNRDEAQELYSKLSSYSEIEHDDPERDKFEICKGKIVVKYDKNFMVNITVGEVSYDLLYKDIVIAAKMLLDK